MSKLIHVSPTNTLFGATMLFFYSFSFLRLEREMLRPSIYCHLATCSSLSQHLQGPTKATLAPQHANTGVSREMKLWSLKWNKWQMLEYAKCNANDYKDVHRQQWYWWALSTTKFVGFKPWLWEVRSLKSCNRSQIRKHLNLCFPIWSRILAMNYWFASWVRKNIANNLQGSNFIQDTRASQGNNSRFK
jgi:hypothetical protein